MKTLIFLIVSVAVLGILVLLPQIEINKDAVIESSAWQWVKAALYFFPMHTVVQIGTIVGGFAIWSIVVAVAKTFWDVLPFH